MAKGLGRKKPKKWAQKASEKMEEKGTVGSFTKIAHSAGYDSPLEYARHVMAAPEKFDPSTVKKANFAKNINK
jgi:hypothetical protein